MKERLHILMMLLLQATKTFVFLKTPSAVTGFTGHATNTNPIRKELSQNGLIVNDLQALPHGFAVLRHDPKLERDIYNQKSLPL